MATLHLIHGFVGAGKTTFARRLARELPAMRLTHDEWMVALYGHDPPEKDFARLYERVSGLIWALTLDLLRLEQDVILDFGFWRRASRDEARAKAQQLGAKIKLYYVTCDERLMLERVAKRNKALPADALWMDAHALELFRARYEPLEEDEAHTVILTG